MSSGPIPSFTSSAEPHSCISTLRSIKLTSSQTGDGNNSLVILLVILDLTGKQQQACLYICAMKHGPHDDPLPCDFSETTSEASGDFPTELNAVTITRTDSWSSRWICFRMVTLLWLEPRSASDLFTGTLSQLMLWTLSLWSRILKSNRFTLPLAITGSWWGKDTPCYIQNYVTRWTSRLYKDGLSWYTLFPVQLYW